jgi:hypothetical protein
MLGPILPVPIGNPHVDGLHRRPDDDTRWWLDDHRLRHDDWGLGKTPDVDASINTRFGNRDAYADISRLRDAACSRDQRG